MLQWPETQNWEDLETAENRIQAKDLSSEFEISQILARLLVSRNLTSKKLVLNFLEPHSKICHDPFLMRDIDFALKTYEFSDLVMYRNYLVSYFLSHADFTHALLLDTDLEFAPTQF